MLISHPDAFHASPARRLTCFASSLFAAGVTNYGRKKKFDAVETTRRIRDAHYEELKDKSQKERIAYYREKSRKLREKLETGRSESA